MLIHNKDENGYLNLLQNILDNGNLREDRTGVGTLSLFGEQLKFNLQNGFPLLTTKKMAWKPIISELLWFLEGSDDERRLAEILYDKDRSELKDKTTIWTANALSRDNHLIDSDEMNFRLTGKIYGCQWRDWTNYRNYNIDQIENLIAGIIINPYGRRHILTAWNVTELDDMCLPPCHVMSQYYINNNKLSCHMYQRSADVFLGVPFNIASYALLTHMIAQVCELEVETLIISFGDVHIYKNHIEQVKEQLKRIPYNFPKLNINKDIDNIDNFKMLDFSLENYQFHPKIKANMAV